MIDFLNWVFLAYSVMITIVIVVKSIIDNKKGADYIKYRMGHDEWVHTRRLAASTLHIIFPGSIPRDTYESDPGSLIRMLSAEVHIQRGNEAGIKALSDELENMKLQLLDKEDAIPLKYEDFLSKMDRLLQDIANEANENDIHLTTRKLAVLRAIRRIREFVEDSRGKYVIQKKNTTQIV